MKNKKTIFILVGLVSLFVVLFIGASVFFVAQGISAANKEQEYFDVYRAKAKEYIESNSEILDKYGDNVSIKFDNSVTYSLSEKRGFFDRFIEIFAPRVPSSLEEFNEGIEMIEFHVKVNGDLYEITFEKDDQGNLAVSSLTVV